MKIRRIKSRGLVISRLPAGQLRLLQQIPIHADPTGSPAAEERLLQCPVRTPVDGTDDEIATDWQEHVVPELQLDFARQIDVVSDDLKRVRRQKAEPGGDDAESAAPPADSYELVIPFDHVDAWYGAINQARLVMQERYRFPEVESVQAVLELFQSENIKPYLTSRFYVEIQAALLELEMDR